MKSVIFFFCWRHGLFLERFSLTPFLCKEITVVISSCSSSSFCHFGEVDFIRLIASLKFTPLKSSGPGPAFPANAFSCYSGVCFLLFSFLLSLMFIPDPSLVPCWCVRPRSFSSLSHWAGDLTWLWSAPPSSHRLPPLYPSSLTAGCGPSHTGRVTSSSVRNETLSWATSSHLIFSGHRHPSG